MHRLLVVALSVPLTLALAPAAAPASVWSPPAGFPVGARSFDESAPRAAVAEDATSVAAWVQGREVRMVTGDARGRFGPPRPVGRWAAVGPAVAAGPGGAALVAWHADDGIRAAVRTRAGSAVRVRLVTASTGSAINGVAVRHDPRGGWVVAERRFPRRGSGVPYRVRTFALEADGTLRLAPADVGRGQFGIDARPVQALAVDRAGRSTLAYVSPGSPGTVMIARGAHGGQLADATPLGPDAQLADPRVVAAPTGGALVTATRVARCGDAGCAGAPFVWRVPERGAPVALGGPSLPFPGRAFGPSVAPLAAGSASLVFQLKDGPRAFSRLAPVKAVTVAADGTAGPLQTLTVRPAQEPVVVALSGSRALTVWAGARGFGAAIAGGDGTYRTTAAPPGPPPLPGHSNATNRDVASAGRYALVAWVRDGRVRLSQRVF